MAITINRTGITLTNDTGTPSSPVGDGTLISAADRTAVLDAIDDLFDGTRSATFTLGTLLAVESFGTHAFSAGGTGTQRLQVRNTTSGTANRASIDVGNNSTAELCRLIALSSAHTASGYLQASGAIVEANGAGGLSIACTDASGVMRFYTGASVTERMRIAADGIVGVGTTPSAAVLHVGGSYSGTGTLTGLKNTVSVTSSAGSNLYGFYNGPTLVEASSGTHAILAGAFLDAPVVTGGAGSVTVGANVYINGAPNASGAANYALYVASGSSGFPDGTSSAPALTFINDTDTGVFLSSAVTGNIGIVGAGTEWVNFVGNISHLWLRDRAKGTGATVGPYLTIGRNSSGSGAAGNLQMTMRSGSTRILWVADDGELHIHSAQPTEDNTTVSDLAGTVVGDQTSTRATKRLIRRFRDTRRALRVIADTPLYRFKYRDGGDRDTEHVGIMAEESPEFTRRRGQSFNPISAFGYTAAAIKALLARVETLEAALAARG